MEVFLPLTIPVQLFESTGEVIKSTEDQLYILKYS